MGSCYGMGPYELGHVSLVAARLRFEGFIAAVGGPML